MTDVIIIGGGIAGCTTAYYLARDGVNVTLLERSALSAMASGSNAGSLHAQIQPEPFLDLGESWVRQFLPALAFYKESMRLWRDIQTTLDADLEVVLSGGIVVAKNDKELRSLEDKAVFERAAGIETQILNASELRDRAPYLASTQIGGTYCPIEGKANPLEAARAFATAARRLGAKILENETVTAIRRSRNNFEVDAGDRTLYAPRVVNAAGNEAGRLAKLVGCVTELESFPIQLSVTEPVAALIPHLVYSAGAPLTLKQNRKGSVLIGGGWPATLDSKGSPSVFRESLVGNLKVAVSTVPELAGVAIARSWAAEVNGNKSWLPVVGEVPGSRGFFINYVPWMGFSGAPIASKIVASLVQGRGSEVAFPIDAFAP